MDTAVQKILLSTLHNALMPFYHEHHFKFKKREHVFFNETGEVYWGIVAKYPDSIHFQPALTVVNAAIIQSLDDILPGQLHTVTRRLPGKTFAEEFGNFDYAHTVNNPGKIDMGIFYRLEEAADVAKVVVDHIAFMHRVGLPFFKKLSTAEGIHEYINGRIMRLSDEEIRRTESRNELKTYYTKREALSGLVACYLISSPDAQSVGEKYLRLFEGNTYVTDDIRKIIDRFGKN